MTPTFELVREKLGKPYDDLMFLLKCLHEVLEESREEELLQHIPWLNERAPITKNIDPHKLLHLYALSFQLLNLIEVNGAVQNRRGKEEHKGLESINGMWGNNLRMLKNEGIKEEEILDVLPHVHVQPVLTAHPTEAKRPVVLTEYRKLYLLLVQRENSMYTQRELEAIRDDIKLSLHHLWLIDDIFLEKPDVKYELANVIHYLENVFPLTIPLMDKKCCQAWEEAGFHRNSLNNANSFPKISFGNWVGGDRDGHPLVTAEITEFTLKKLRMSAFSLLKDRLNKLSEKLSFYFRYENAPEKLQERIKNITRELGECTFDIIDRYNKEVFRQFVHLLIAKMPIESSIEKGISLHERKGSYIHSYQLIDDLQLLSDSLEEIQANNVARNDLKDAIRLVQTFGFHLAQLDIRQNSSYYEKALSQLIQTSEIGDYDYENWDEEKRMEFLNAELKTNRPFTRNFDLLEDEAKSVVDCFSVLEKHILKYQHFSLGSLIVSMTRSVSDLLMVYLLARETGLTHVYPAGISISLPVVPLFETIDDLDRSPEIMDQYFSHPVVKESLKHLQKINHYDEPVQEIMIGYSDSNKDGGIIASAFHLYSAQTKLIETGRRHGIRIKFFHGKGGTISRGAGPTHWFLRSLPDGSIDGNIKITEQGETIERKYANRTNAAYNLELLISGASALTVLQKFRDKDDAAAFEILELMSEESLHHYKNLTQDPDFIQFFRQATPIDAIETSKIGSRPSRRTGKNSLDDLRAIPWVFSWSQSRFNITSWYGVGSTLYFLKEQYPDKFTRLQELTKADPVIRYVFTNIDTSLAATDEKIISEYAELVEDDAVREKILNKIFTELSLTREMIIELIPRPLKERRKNHHYSTILRAEALENLHQFQIELLREWRGLKKKSQEPQEDKEISLLKSINAIANAMGNTG